MFAFDTRRPTSLDAIEQYIGSYATPEAAESDTRWNAPQGLNFLTDQYRSLTGDEFADPFADASNNRAKAMTQAATNGASVATGSNTGMKLLSLPNTIPSPQQQQPALGVTPLLPPPPPAPSPISFAGTPLSPSGKREVGNSLFTGMLQAQGRDYQLANKNLEIPIPNANNYLQVLEKRANLTGTANEFKEIWRTNPDVFRTPMDEKDPRFSRTQAGKAIGMDIHPLAYDDTFQQLARRDPAKAAALYRATTNRDYDTDVKAKSQLLVEQRDARKKIIEGIKHLEADPVTGGMFKVVESRDFDGSIKQQRVPISPLEKAAIDAEGGSKRIYGVDLPGQGGLPKIPGTTPEEHSLYTSRTQKIIKEHPDMSVTDASKLAHRQLFAEQQQKKQPPKPSRMMQVLNSGGQSMVDAEISGANLIPKLMNFLLTRGQYTGGEHGGGYANSQAPVPLIPHPNWQDPGFDVTLPDLIKSSRESFANY